ncbi:MAG TPA: protein kinase family protein [Vicinamibacterales bacterium]
MLPVVHRDLKPDNIFDLVESLRLFERAAEFDPGYRTRTWVWPTWRRYWPTSRFCAWWTTLHEWNFPRAEQIFQHALSLDDACIEAHAFFGLLCGTLQREDDVVAHMSRLVQLDPLSPWTHGVSAFAHHTLGRDEVALRESATALGLRADSMIGLWCKGVALRGLNRFPEAIATFERAAELMPSALYLLCELGCTCARAGDSARAEGILRTLDERATMVDVAPFWRGTILFGLGRVDEAYADLERGLPPSVAQARGPGVDPNIR